MLSETDYAALLAEMEKEKENLEAAMAFVRKKMGLNSASPEGPATGPDRIKPDSFYRLGIGEATVAYLRMTNRTPKTTPEIAEALERGGIEHQSKDFRATVNALLIRDANKWGITRLKNGAWALDEWYDRERKQLKRGQGRSKERTEEAAEEAADAVEEDAADVPF